MKVPVQSLLFADPREAADLAAFLGRLLHYDRAAAVRLQAGAATHWPCSAARPPSRCSRSVRPAWPAPRRSTSRCRRASCWSPSTSPGRARASGAVRCPPPSPGRPGPASCRPGDPGANRPACPGRTPCAPPRRGRRRIPYAGRGAARRAAHPRRARPYRPGDLVPARRRHRAAAAGGPRRPVPRLPARRPWLPRLAVRLGRLAAAADPVRVGRPAPRSGERAGCAGPDRRAQLSRAIRPARQPSSSPWCVSRPC